MSRPAKPKAQNAEVVRPKRGAPAGTVAADAAKDGKWPEDTLGILTLIQEHQGSGAKKWGANHEGLPRATIDRLVREQLVQEVFMSGLPVTTKHPRKHFPTLLITTDAGDALVATGNDGAAAVGTAPAPPDADVQEEQPPLRAARPAGSLAADAIRWANRTREQVARLTATERETFYEIHAAETLRIAIQAAKKAKIPEPERELVARAALASHPELRPFLEVLPAEGSTLPGAPVVLVACAAQKVDTHGQRVPAADLYSSPLFRKSLAYARAITSEDNIRILSARHGVMRLDDRIGTYETPMSKLSKRESSAWAERARNTIMSEFGHERSRQVVFLAGDDYEIGLPGQWLVARPLAGKSIGQRLHWLNDQLRALGASETPAPKVAPPRRAQIRLNTKGRPWRDVEALAWNGDLFIHEDNEDPDILRVTHAPTGRMMPDPFSDLVSALSFAVELNDPAVRPALDALIQATAKRGKDAITVAGRRLRQVLDAREAARGRAAAPAPLDEAPPSSQLALAPDAPPAPARARTAGFALLRAIPRPPATPPARLAGFALLASLPAGRSAAG